ncbi:MAG TPA: ComF family protein [Clostridia bacterium]|nr:ComF family protein [Clostridia bacterium]
MIAGWEQWRTWLNAGLSFFYPELCQLCREERAGPGEGFVCGSCASHIRWIERPWCERCGMPMAGAITTRFECGDCQQADLSYGWARASAAVRAGRSSKGDEKHPDPLLEAIHRYKYQQAFWVEPFLARVLVERAREPLASTRWDWIVPVPLHPVKQRERQFNQAERLSRHLGHAIGVPVHSRLLKRVRFTRTQTQLTRKERLANVSGAFEVCSAQGVSGARILVFDDVFTTGATTNACARELMLAGAQEVCVWTVARGI